MEELTALLQSVPWATVGIAFVAINVVMLVLKITKKLIMLGIGVALIAIGLYTGVIHTPDILCAISAWI